MIRLRSLLGTGASRFVLEPLENFIPILQALPESVMENHSKITTSFNVLLILYSAACGVLGFVLSDAAKGVPPEGIVLTSLVDFARFLVMMVISAWFAKEVWNRLLTDLFELRCVLFREAITFVVVLGIIFS